MRFVKTLALVPLVAVLLASDSISAKSLPISQNKPSANAPQNKIVASPKPSIKLDRTQAASRSAKRYPYSSPNYNKKFAKTYMQSKYHWSSKQHSCLVTLWNHESGWRTKADNPNSSAYGIPQALPGHKMGKGWKTNPHVQIKWGLKYLKNRYGSPCKGLSFWNKHHWY